MNALFVAHNARGAAATKLDSDFSVTAASVAPGGEAAEAVCEEALSEASAQ